MVKTGKLHIECIMRDKKNLLFLSVRQDAPLESSKPSTRLWCLCDAIILHFVSYKKKNLN